MVLKKNQDGKKLTTILFVYWQQNFITKKNQPVTTPPPLYWLTPKNKRGGGARPRTKKYLIGEIGHFTGSAVLSGQTNHFDTVAKSQF